MAPPGRHRRTWTFALGERITALVAECVRADLGRISWATTTVDMRRSVSVVGCAKFCLTSPPNHARAAGLADVHVEDEGVVSVISFYLYALIGLSLLIVISPLIIIAVPLLFLLGPVGLAWWRGRRATPRVGAPARWLLLGVSLVVLAMPFVPALWYLVADVDGAPPESFWLIVIGVVLLPLTLATATYALRWGRVSEGGSAAPS
jgi:hypothetical protein